MGRHKDSKNKTSYQLSPSGQLSLDDKLKLIAGIIVDRILDDISSINAEAETNV
jgi:hypothetical protein